MAARVKAKSLIGVRTQEYLVFVSVEQGVCAVAVGVHSEDFSVQLHGANHEVGVLDQEGEVGR